MSVANRISERIILPVSDIFLGNSINSNLIFLNKSQWWTKDQLNDYQNVKLNRLIHHAYNNVPYYRELFDQINLKPENIKTKDDLNKIPILTKDVLRENFKNNKIFATNIQKSKMILSSSSGSTGEPLQYFESRDSYSFSRAAAIRGWYWMGYRLGDKYVKLSQNPRNENKKKLQDTFNNSLYLFSQQLTDDNFKKIVEQIQLFKPKVIRGYPDPLLFLANYLKKNNISISPPLAIATTGNILFPSSRKTIEEQFQCKLFDSYSCEGGANVSECNTHTCYHSTMEYAISEIIKNDNEVSQGQQGRLITTDLINYATPFIRYDTQDHLVKAEDNCVCGRQLLTIKEIKGRDSDILITPSRKYLIVHNFTGYFGRLSSVDQFQVLQHAIDKIEILLKVNNQYNLSIEKEIYSYWKKYIGAEVNIKLTVVNQIPIGKNGKRRFLIRNPDVYLDF